MKPRVLGITALVAVVILTTMAQMTRTAHAQIPAEVVGVEWQWRGTLFNNGGIVRPADPGSYTLQFAADESVAVQADCNTGGGGYTTAATSAVGGAMRIGPDRIREVFSPHRTLLVTVRLAWKQGRLFQYRRATEPFEQV